MFWRKNARNRKMSFKSTILHKFAARNIKVILKKQILNMVKHIILWTLREELSEEEKTAVKAGIKEGLESLAGVVPGLIEVMVSTEGRLPSSTADVMLDCTLESPEALKAYAAHPAHLAVANTKVRPYTALRTCLDYEF